MKREKGSALLTTILIIFVLGTIGSALGSFVIYNYKLREHDNKIGRAEYETEKAVDAVLVYIKQEYRKALAETRNAAETEVNNTITNFSDKNAINNALNESVKAFLPGKMGNLTNFASVTKADGLNINSELDCTSEISSNKIINKIGITHSGTKPAIKLSLDIVLTIPDFHVIQGDYDVDLYVNIKNYTMQNWGYL